MSDGPTLHIGTTTYKGRTMTITPPLAIPIDCSEINGDDWFSVSDPDFCLYAGAATLVELSEDAAESLFFVWDNYAREYDSNLTRDAQRLKATLLARVKVTP